MAGTEIQREEQRSSKGRWGWKQNCEDQRAHASSCHTVGPLKLLLCPTFQRAPPDLGNLSGIFKSCAIPTGL